MRGKVTGSFVLVRPITTDAFGALQRMLGETLDLSGTDVRPWRRPSLSPDKSDGVEVSGIIEADDEWDANNRFGLIVRTMLKRLGWHEAVARLETEVVRVDYSAGGAALVVDAVEYTAARVKVAA